MTAVQDRKLQRKLDRLNQDEARWLQKMAFALSKAQETREKLADALGEKVDPMITLDDGTTVSLEEVERHLRERVDELRTDLGVGNYRFGGG